MRFSFQLIALLVLPTLARADGPSDLHVSLQRLHGHAAVKMDAAYAVWQERTTLVKPTVHERSLRFQVLEDDPGLHVDWNLPAADPPHRDEALPSHDASVETPLGEVLKDLDAATLDGLLNPADELSRVLAVAQFKAEGRETYQGKVVRVLMFTCKPLILPPHQGRVTQAESSFRIWIGDDGVPLATEAATDYVGKHSRLYGRIHNQSRVRTIYAVLGQRLVVASQTSEDFTYDYGDKMKQRKTLTLTQKG